MTNWLIEGICDDLMIVSKDVMRLRVGCFAEFCDYTHTIRIEEEVLVSKWAKERLNSSSIENLCKTLDIGCEYINPYTERPWVKQLSVLSTSDEIKRKIEEWEFKNSFAHSKKYKETYSGVLSLQDNFSILVFGIANAINGGSLDAEKGKECIELMIR